MCYSFARRMTCWCIFKKEVPENLRLLFSLSQQLLDFVWVPGSAVLFPVFVRFTELQLHALLFISMSQCVCIDLRIKIRGTVDLKMWVSAFS